MRYGHSESDAGFLDLIPEELIAEMIEEQYVLRDHLEAKLTENTEDQDLTWAQRELARVEDLLGLRSKAMPMRTGDVVTDYLMRRQLSGEITPEDLDLSPADIRKLLAKEARTKKRT